MPGLGFFVEFASRPSCSVRAGQTPLADIEFMEKVLAVIEARGIPAPAPLEQRWTARSQAPMSPAFSPTPGDLFSWVGIIMYNTPGQDEQGSNFAAEHPPHTHTSSVL